MSRTFGFGKSKAQVANQNGQQTGGQGNDRAAGGRRGNSGGGGGGGTRVMSGGGGGGPMMMMMGGNESKPYNLTVGLRIDNLFNRNNLGTPVGNISSDRFGQSTSTAGGFGFFGGGGGFFGGGSSANRRVELSLRFSF